MNCGQEFKNIRWQQVQPDGGRWQFETDVPLNPGTVEFLCLMFGSVMFSANKPSHFFIDTDDPEQITKALMGQLPAESEQPGQQPKAQRYRSIGEDWEPQKPGDA